MAFCNSCGTSITPGTRFCSKCGAPILSSTLPPAGASPAAPIPPATAAPGMPPAAPVANPPHGGGALKIILIAVGVIVLLGVIAIGSIAFFALHMARHAHVREQDGNVHVDTPFGSVETTKDPTEAARTIGVDLYPGADVQKNGSASATFGGMHTATLNAESSDSFDKVAGFYKARFPNAMVSTSDSGHCTIVSKDHESMITINIQAEGDKTNIQISNVSRK